MSGTDTPRIMRIMSEYLELSGGRIELVQAAAGSYPENTGVVFNNPCDMIGLQSVGIVLISPVMNKTISLTIIEVKPTAVNRDPEPPMSVFVKRCWLALTQA